MTVHEPLNFMPLDLDTFSGSERFMAGTRLGAAFSQGIRAYLRAAYADAIEHFKAALIYHALLQWRPQEHYARYLLGNLLARTRRLDQAMEAYSQIPPQDKHFV